MGDQSGRYTGATGDLGQGGADEADFGERVDGHVDQLAAPRLLKFRPDL